mmetsp:Transcript_6220/g.10386  ORF Transcript_6220/g.10386 Transcript_6220/m.10386 type:complete len:88 (+) Transcript_6220:74-337(+)|eukprot:CAMPEP_0181037942 /NCGR_PEP_ID=MMETSP1070-20121207/9673_1 /TAXON_ID=265543 /ORGANISM="Minutocellus polymorphus, Strain NH13" /LENGTH=87 /DNA_ID=CAMNT_0023115697 /DNA_START=46 /DNA_END=309 /DNA_ORIENTATION=+
MSFVEKLITPGTYKSAWSNFVASSSAYYKPMFRSGSVTPLWHFMLLTSVVMYSASYTYKGIAVQEARQEKKVALEEYYEKHGKSGHH